jgi:hypothetical protein
MVDLLIAAIRMAVLMDRKVTSFLQESQKNLPLTIEPRVLLARPQDPPEPQSLSPRGVCGELALEPTSLAYESSLYSWPELLSSQ